MSNLVPDLRVCSVSEHVVNPLVLTILRETIVQSPGKGLLIPSRDLTDISMSIQAVRNRIEKIHEALQLVPASQPAELSSYRNRLLACLRYYNMLHHSLCREVTLMSDLASFRTHESERVGYVRFFCLVKMVQVLNKLSFQVLQDSSYFNIIM